MGGSHGVSPGPQPTQGKPPRPPLTFEDEWHEGDEGGLHLGQHFPVGLVVPAGVLGGIGGVRLWGEAPQGALDPPPPCWWPWVWGWWAGGERQGHPGMPWECSLLTSTQNTPRGGLGTPKNPQERLGDPPNAPRGGLGTPRHPQDRPGDSPTPTAAPTALTHRQVLKLPKQILEFPWELLESKKGREGR